MDVPDLHDVDPGDDPHCNWCQHAVRDPVTDEGLWFNVIWLREGDGKWRPHGRGKPGITSADWHWLYDHRGPHNMAAVDLYVPNSDGFMEHLVWQSERAALTGLLAESSGRDVPLYKTWAYGSLLSAYKGMCVAWGEHIPRCPSRATHYVLFAESECCQAADGPHDHHALCEKHTATAIDGGLTFRDQPVTVALSHPVVEDAKAVSF